MSQFRKDKGSDVDYLVALGSNTAQDIDQSVKFVRAGLRALDVIATAPITQSQLYQSKAYPSGSGPDFINAAAMVRSSLTPAQFLTALHVIEAENGRIRTQRWGQRTLDIDLLGCGDLVLPDETTLRRWMGLTLDEQQRETPQGLLVPHPRLHERAFVLFPLRDVAPDWRHPILGQSVAELAVQLPMAAQNTVNALAISDSRP